MSHWVENIFFNVETFFCFGLDMVRAVIMAVMCLVMVLLTVMCFRRASVGLPLTVKPTVHILSSPPDGGGGS